MTAFERIARRAVLGLLARLRSGRLSVDEGSRRLVLGGGGGGPRAALEVRSPRLWPLLLLHGSRGLAQAYGDGLWDSSDLSALVRLAARNVSGLDRWRARAAPLRVPLQVLRGLRARNTPARSRRAIAAHYDLGNELFEAMLGETMMYSCAYFPREEMTLAEAQEAKLELICDQLQLGPDDDVLEIGTGWGGFAVHAARTRGCRVTSTTISREQCEYARARVREAGLTDRVDVLCEDYRDLRGRGRYDKLVSIEMIEAVGARELRTFFSRCSQLLADDGAMLLQAIVIDDRAYEVEKASRSFIRTYIFPDGCLPSREVIARCLARRTDMRTVGLRDLSPHYAETLRRWRARFERATQLGQIGCDERFRRLWRLYLAYCEAGFEERRIGVVQMLLGKPRWRGERALASGERGRSAAAA